jgi:hypothetical protein
MCKDNFQMACILKLCEISFNLTLSLLGRRSLKENEPHLWSEQLV